MRFNGWTDSLRKLIFAQITFYLLPKPHVIPDNPKTQRCQAGNGSCLCDYYTWITVKAVGQYFAPVCYVREMQTLRRPSSGPTPPLQDGLSAGSRIAKTVQCVAWCYKTIAKHNDASSGTTKRVLKMRTGALVLYWLVFRENWRSGNGNSIFFK